MADEEQLRLAEALVFASAEPVSARALQQLLPPDADAEAVLGALRERCTGRGVTLVAVAGGWQFRTAPDLAPVLRRVVAQPRRLPRAAMETLAIIAYHQPVTRPEIEEMRGTSLSQQTMDALLEAGLIAAGGRREVPGRPTLWATTPASWRSSACATCATCPSGRTCWWSRRPSFRCRCSRRRTGRRLISQPRIDVLEPRRRCGRDV